LSAQRLVREIEHQSPAVRRKVLENRLPDRRYEGLGASVPRDLDLHGKDVVDVVLQVLHDLPDKVGLRDARLLADMRPPRLEFLRGKTMRNERVRDEKRRALGLRRGHVFLVLPEL